MSPVHARLIGTARYSVPAEDEVRVFAQRHVRNLDAMLTDPGGCGKNRCVKYMARRLRHPPIAVTCHDALTARDLVSHFLIRHDGVRWHDGDGPLARSAGRRGMIRSMHTPFKIF